MAKVNTELLERAIGNIKAFASGEKITKNGEELEGKQRKFVETIDLQVTLKSYDRARTSGSRGRSGSPWCRGPT